MKNWDTLEADENLLMNTHYTPGRSGQHRQDRHPLTTTPAI